MKKGFQLNAAKEFFNVLLNWKHLLLSSVSLLCITQIKRQIYRTLKTKLKSQLVAKGLEQCINHLKKIDTTKPKSGAEERNDVTHSDMNETFVTVSLFLLFSSGKKQSNQKNKTKQITVHLPEGGGSVELEASEVWTSPSWEIKHLILTQ